MICIANLTVLQIIFVSSVSFAAAEADQVRAHGKRASSSRFSFTPRILSIAHDPIQSQRRRKENRVPQHTSNCRLLFRRWKKKKGDMYRFPMCANHQAQTYITNTTAHRQTKQYHKRYSVLYENSVIGLCGYMYHLSISPKKRLNQKAKESPGNKEPRPAKTRPAYPASLIKKSSAHTPRFFITGH
ncbi:hypothetical protein V8C35DRAFT_36577 [Trichoderma chlorosporum]